MNADVSPINTAAAPASPVRPVTLWVSQLVVAAILGMAAFPKLFDFTPEGSMPLAEALGVGRGIVAAIGLFETAAVIAILTPRLHAVGAALAVATSLGALVAHATAIGFGGSALADMWVLALVVLAASATVLVMRGKELPLVGDRV